MASLFTTHNHNGYGYCYQLQFHPLFSEAFKTLFPAFGSYGTKKNKCVCVCSCSLLQKKQRNRKMIYYAMKETEYFYFINSPNENGIEKCCFAVCGAVRCFLSIMRNVCCLVVREAIAETCIKSHSSCTYVRVFVCRLWMELILLRYGFYGIDPNWKWDQA